MQTVIAELNRLVRTMSPVLNPGVFVFATLADESVVDLRTVVACIREREGLSVVLAEADAIRLNIPIVFRAAWLTLSVHSDLNAVGLTAAVAATLARAGISCNVIAGTQHDHVFVPYEQADAAMTALLELQDGTAR